MFRTTPAGSDVESVSSFGVTSAGQDKEYRPEESSEDDERTIGKEEDRHDEEEIGHLEKDAEIPLEELLRKFCPDVFEDGKKEDEEKENEKEKEKEAEEGKENKAEEQGKENKTEEEKSVREPCTEAGKEETEEEVAQPPGDDPGKRAETERADQQDQQGSEAKKQAEEDEKDDDDKDNLKALVEEDPALFDAVETAEAFQPTGNTLDTTTVKTPVPFLLRHKLREYQHIGLDWLVSLHERSFNGILADEMGLGKTIQTIALLAHLACAKGNWGPHLIVVPTSVMLNWEMEVKKWCPAFKVLTYYGSQKERRLKRVGWTKPNAFHVCITSYKLVVQDHSSFRRKQWYYFILDEAQHIKNFKSQRWQMLLNFSSVGRLLLTGTPLQNNLMELWSLMHFLMPNVFQSHRNFKEWFSNPLTGMVEDTQEYNESLVRRLHKVLRPFLLRRLKNEVEKQLPKKYEHVVYCPLSKRQRFLYDDFMSRGKTRETLAGGNFMSVINILMQLRKVCNHPNLFEARPTLSPFVCEPVRLLDSIPRRVFNLLERSPLDTVDLSEHPACILTQELRLTGFAAHSAARLQNRHSYSVQSLSIFRPLPRCPPGKIRMTMRYVSSPTYSGEHIPLATIVNNNIYKKTKADLNIRTDKGTFLLTAVTRTRALSPFDIAQQMLQMNGTASPPGSPEEEEKRKLPSLLTTSKAEREEEDGAAAPPVKRSRRSQDGREASQEPKDERKGIFCSKIFHSYKTGSPVPSTIGEDQRAACRTRVESHIRTNRLKVMCCPMFGRDLVESVRVCRERCPDWLLEGLWGRLAGLTSRREQGRGPGRDLDHTPYSIGLQIPGGGRMSDVARAFLSRFHLYVPAVVGSLKEGRLEVGPSLREELGQVRRAVESMSAFQCNLQLPEARLIQYDCGKLQVLSQLLHRLKSGGHRVLLFTQMTRVLDVLEAFLNYHGYVYLRLDGSTRVEQRQVLMERFNGNDRYFCFILSTRSGGVGVNLTGADTVVFYDSDWNPTMDAQAQDRCHRIGQTRDVHIYRLVSERTVEENILKKANQKRMLGDLAIDGGNFTTAQLKTQTIRDLFGVEEEEEDQERKKKDEQVAADEVEEGEKSTDVAATPTVSERKTTLAFENAMATVEDVTDKEVQSALASGCL